MTFRCPICDAGHVCISLSTIGCLECFSRSPARMVRAPSGGNLPIAFIFLPRQIV